MEEVNKKFLKLKYIVEHKRELVTKDEMARVIPVIERIIRITEDQLVRDQLDLSDQLMDDMHLADFMIDAYVTDVDDAVIDAEWREMRAEMMMDTP